MEPSYRFLFVLLLDLIWLSTIIPAYGQQANTLLAHGGDYHITIRALARVNSLTPFDVMIYYDGPSFHEAGFKDTVSPQIEILLPPGTSFISSSPYATLSGSMLSLLFFGFGSIHDSLRITLRALAACQPDTLHFRSLMVDGGDSPRAVLAQDSSASTVVTSGRYQLKLIRDTSRTLLMGAVPLKVNNAGIVSGTIQNGGQPFGFVWKSGGMYRTFTGTDVHPLTSSIAYDLNDAGDVAYFGRYIGSLGFVEAQYLWQLTDESTLTGTSSLLSEGSIAEVLGINKAGKATGNVIKNGRYHAATWNAGPPQFLDTLKGTTASEGYCISNTEDLVVGMIQDSNLIPHLAFWKNGSPQLIDLGDQKLAIGSGFMGRRTLAMNNREQIVGTTQDSGHPTGGHAFLRDMQSGSTASLKPFPQGTTTFAYGVNKYGEVVGWSDGIAPSPKAKYNIGCLWIGGKIIDLNCLIDPVTSEIGGGWIKYATDINDSGVIVGQYYNPDRDEYYGCIMYPEPSTSSVEPVTALSHDFQLQLMPNPLMATRSTEARIQFELPSRTKIKLELFNVAGNRITTITEGWFDAGVHTTSFDASALAPGSYLLRIESAAGIHTTRIVVLR